MGSVKKTDQKPHVVCLPAPLQGHLNPMHKLAKLLHHKGFHITFVNTEYIEKRILKSRGPDSLKGLPDFQFKTIQDGLQTSDIDYSQDILSLVVSTRKNCLVPFRNLLAKLNENGPPVTCIVSDGNMSFSLQAAQELGIPAVIFWTTSACGFMCYLHYKDFIHKGYHSKMMCVFNNEVYAFGDFKVCKRTAYESYLTNGYLETSIDWIPGMKDIRLRDIPSFVRTTDPNDLMMDFFIGETERASKASAIILNTFDAFENDVLDGIKTQMSLPPIYTIGPLQLLTNQLPKESPVQSLGSNLWKEEPECLQWLDSQKPNSVVYVNFGSITVMTNQHLLEFAWGLANSKQTFLWVIRPDLVKGDTAILPPEFTTESKERCFIASWCPQEQVLNHLSIGGFLTHSGWNSTLDTVCGGVPVICWPFFAEQQTNCRYSCRHWCFGMEIDNNVKRDEVEILVRELMEGEKGKEMKNKALEWKKKAEEAASVPGGSSYVNLDKLIKEILVTKHNNQ